VPKIITIGSVGSSPHIGEIYGYEECLPFFFFYSSTSLQTEQEYQSGPYCLNRRRFSQGSAFWGSEYLQKKF
jgi:hypothetical protein